MKYNIIKVHQGRLPDDESDITLYQLCQTRNIRPERIIEMVEEGVMNPDGETRIKWRFSPGAIEHVMKVGLLQRDLHVNLAGAALALDSLDRIARLESMLGR